MPVGLKESISKVRSSVAYAVSAIAHWDWPEEWPELFGILMQALTSSDPNAVHGAMRVLTGKGVHSALTVLSHKVVHSAMRMLIGNGGAAL